MKWYRVYEWKNNIPPFSFSQGSADLSLHVQIWCCRTIKTGSDRGDDDARDAHLTSTVGLAGAFKHRFEQMFMTSPHLDPLNDLISPCQSAGLVLEPTHFLRCLPPNNSSDFLSFLQRNDREARSHGDPSRGLCRGKRLLFFFDAFSEREIVNTWSETRRWCGHHTWHAADRMMKKSIQHEAVGALAEARLLWRVFRWFDLFLCFRCTGASALHGE